MIFYFLTIKLTCSFIFLTHTLLKYFWLTWKSLVLSAKLQIILGTHSVRCFEQCKRKLFPGLSFSSLFFFMQRGTGFIPCFLPISPFSTHDKRSHPTVTSIFHDLCCVSCIKGFLNILCTAHLPCKYIYLFLQRALEAFPWLKLLPFLNQFCRF